jgi:AcrR family transcriptional regulator
MAERKAISRIAERKLRDREARRVRIITAAKEIAEREGWANVTVRRLAEEIAYSQPVLYTHFENREAILAAVAIEGFKELGKVLEKARLGAKRESALEPVAVAYLEFAASSPALYEVMFSVGLNVPFGDSATPSELRFGFSQLSKLFEGRTSNPEIHAELFWAELHGVAELTRTKRLPRKYQKERMRALVKLFASR